MRGGPKSDDLDEVVLAAGAAFDRHGWQEATVSQIASEVGVSRGFLYKRFGGRDDLVLAALRRRGREFNRLAGPLLAGADFPESLVQGLLLGLEATQRDCTSGPLLGLTQSPAGSLRDALLSAAVQIAGELWLPALEHARAAGRLSPDVALDDVVEWVVMLQMVLASHKKLAHVGRHTHERWVRSMLLPVLDVGPLTSGPPPEAERRPSEPSPAEGALHAAS